MLYLAYKLIHLYIALSSTISISGGTELIKRLWIPVQAMQDFTVSFCGFSSLRFKLRDEVMCYMLAPFL